MSGSVATPPMTRFRGKYAIDSAGCWIWTGSLNRSGYALFYDGQKMVIAHRWAYQQLVGSLEANLETDHLCRVRRCVNPSHLEPVTKAENVRRGYAARDARTHCKHGHPFDAANTYIPPGRPRRQCRACKRAQTPGDQPAETQPNR